MLYRCAVDPRAEKTRQQMRQIPARDLGGAARWALHMSHEERDYLERMNPDFSMDEFIKAPEAKAYLIRERI
jgi:hypothetical protein